MTPLSFTVFILWGWFELWHWMNCPWVFCLWPCDLLWLTKSRGHCSVGVGEFRGTVLEILLCTHCFCLSNAYHMLIKIPTWRYHCLDKKGLSLCKYQAPLDHVTCWTCCLLQPYSPSVGENSYNCNQSIGLCVTVSALFAKKWVFVGIKHRFSR